MLDQNVTIMQPFKHAKIITLAETYLYQKDERALPGNLQNRRKNKKLWEKLKIHHRYNRSY
jgi:hypothetical protein